MLHKPEFLVVDTTAFIQNAPLQDLGQNVLTIEEVVQEITSKRQLRRLVVLPYDLKITTVFQENINFITEFSKKTGDYLSLSATDIKLMALVYQLEKEHVGIDHLKTAPANNKIVSLDPPQLSSKDLVGFFKGDESGGKKTTDTSGGRNTPLDGEDSDQHFNGDSETSETKILDEEHVEPISSSTQTDDCKISSPSSVESDYVLEENLSTLTITDVLKPIVDDGFESDSCCEEGGEESDSEDEDESDWITPENVKQMKQQMDFGVTEDKQVTVACVTTDFAMQNVLKQIGLNIVGLNGRVIKHLRTFIFRCYACFNTTSNMTKVFCPKCGNKTLKKVAVSVGENGQQKIHINPGRPLTARGKRFSLPKPQGGKHANNPILCEDQPLPDQRPTRLARTKTNPLDDDYIAGFSPFVMRDVNSKSAMLGIRGKNQQVKYWMRKNPNEVVKHRKKKK